MVVAVVAQRGENGVQGHIAEKGQSWALSLLYVLLGSFGRMAKMARDEYEGSDHELFTGKERQKS